MFCNQCEQTSKGMACTSVGVCGKSADVAELQDALLYALIGLCRYAREGRKAGVNKPDLNRFMVEALFATLTNVNFDADRLAKLIHQTVDRRELLKKELTARGLTLTADAAMSFQPSSNITELINQARKIVLIHDETVDADIMSLQQLLIYGVKGIAAYAHHAGILNQESDKVYSFIEEALSSIGNPDLDVNAWLQLAIKCGETNLLAMELLDKGNTEEFGHPVPTKVPLGHIAGKCILVSGHELNDLKNLLEATEGKDINIYTHGEMLPAHGYPGLKKFPHLYGNYGTAWQNQKKEFAGFPGPILMTTNCIQEPAASYKETIFTSGPVGWPGVKHIVNHNYEELIATARNMPGFTDDEDKGSVMVGFARNAVMSVADQVIDAIKKGAIKHIFLVGGCEGARASRSYYTEFVEKTPPDTLVLTLGCGKYRFYDKKLGTIGGIPRLLDVGQCNDAYSAIQIAVALSKAFACDVNELPLSLVLSWYEQKAVSILLTLLYLGIKNIRIGPTLPAFLSPNVIKVLVEQFGLKPIGTPEEDLAAILG
ncbi:MAG: hydroxylamine reductase [Syntrophomonadaceae bacterium]|jgi:hydroxylamine reductase